jgi:hypothetical protein
MAKASIPVQLKTKTLQRFDAYIRDAEAEMERTLEGDRFLWSDSNVERAKAVGSGQVVAEFWTGNSPIKVPNGLIHDWIGAELIPAVPVEDVLALIQDYDNHTNVYKPEVVASKLIKRQGNDFQLYLRLRKQKIITVILDTDHNAEYRCIDRTRWVCRSHTTRVAEVEDAGSPQEKVMPPDTGHGFLWRLNSYWRFQQGESGVCVECRAISLTRDVPFGMGWLIEPIIEKLPKESLINTLAATRRAVQICSK